MIEWISDWSGSIIVAVIIGTIIEMILPEGNSKKYIKMVIGIYILFTIISPVITKFTGKTIEISKDLELDTYIDQASKNAKLYNTIEQDNNESILNIYKSGIEDDIKAKLELKGYSLNKIHLIVSDDNTYKINAIKINISNKEEKGVDKNAEISDSKNNISIDEIESVKKVSIESNSNELKNEVEEAEKNVETENKLTNNQIKELKEYLSDIYEVEENNIIINE